MVAVCSRGAREGEEKEENLGLVQLLVFIQWRRGGHWSGNWIQRYALIATFIWLLLTRHVKTWSLWSIVCPCWCQCIVLGTFFRKAHWQVVKESITKPKQQQQLHAWFCASVNLGISGTVGPLPPEGRFAFKFAEKQKQRKVEEYWMFYWWRMCFQTCWTDWVMRRGRQCSLPLDMIATVTCRGTRVRYVHLAWHW